MRCLKRSCPASLLRVERLTDHCTTRIRVVCVAGHSAYFDVDKPAPGRPVERKQPAPSICGECHEPLEQPQGTDARHHRYYHPACGVRRQRRRMRDYQRAKRLA